LRVRDGGKEEEGRDDAETRRRGEREARGRHWGSG
jgi:hypothetical protein